MADPNPKTPTTAKQLTPVKGLPGLPTLPNMDKSKPTVVVVMGGKNKGIPGLPLSMNSKQKKKKKKKSKKSKNKKKKGSKSTSNNEDSDSDRVTTPDLPNAHRRAPPPGVNVLPPMIVDKNCVPQNIVIDGPAGCPIVVPLDAKDSKGQYVNDVMPLTRAPAQVTRGWMFTDSKSLIQFKPDNGKDAAPPSSTRGILTKILADTSAFISDSGPQLPEYAAGQGTKEKVGDAIPVSGFVELNAATGTCRFKLVTSNTPAPIYPTNASMGVLVREPESGYVFFVPTEGRPVGPVLGTAAPIPEKKKVAEGTMIGQIVKSICGTPKWEPLSDKKDNVLGYIMSSATGVPIYIPRIAEQQEEEDDNEEDAKEETTGAPPDQAAAGAPPAAAPAAPQTPDLKHSEFKLQEQDKKIEDVVSVACFDNGPQSSQPSGATFGSGNHSSNAMLNQANEKLEANNNYQKFLNDRSAYM